MTTDQQATRHSPASLMWGIFWRSVVWYAATGAVLGGLYGCSFVALAIFSFEAGDGAGDLPVWAIRMMVLFCGVAGWLLAHFIAKELRPLLGAVIGAMAGIPLGEFYFMFAYLIAFPAGVILGGTYGLAVGLLNAFLLTVVTHLFFIPLSDPQSYRRAAVATNMLGVMIVPSFWGVSLLFFPGWGGVSGLTGSAAVDLWIYIGLPSLILLLTAQWFGERLAGWYAHSLAPGPSDRLPLLQEDRLRLLHWRRICGESSAGARWGHGSKTATLRRRCRPLEVESRFLDARNLLPRLQ
jgi:hypothetical protein